MSARADTETEWTVWLRFCDFPFPFAVSVDAIYPLIHDLGNLEMFWICVVRESTHRRTGMHTGDKNEIKGREKKSIDRWPNSNATSDSQLLIRGGKNDSFPNQGICPRIFQGPFRIYVCGINGVNPTDSNLFPGVSGFFLGNAASFANLSRGMRRGIEHFDNVGIISFFMIPSSSSIQPLTQPFLLTSQYLNLNAQHIPFVFVSQFGLLLIFGDLGRVIECPIELDHEWDSILNTIYKRITFASSVWQNSHDDNKRIKI